MGFHGETVAALQIFVGNSGLGLVHELFDLGHHFLLAGGELASGEFLQVLFGCGPQLFGSVTLL